MMIIIQSFTIKNGYSEKEWCYKIGAPILSVLYIVLNVLLCVRFLKVNKLIKSGIILAIIDLLLYLPPTFIKSKNAFIQNEVLNDANVLKANFACWKGEYLDNNVHCIICLTLAFLSSVLFVLGLIKRLRKIVKKRGGRIKIRPLIYVSSIIFSTEYFSKHAFYDI